MSWQIKNFNFIRRIQPPCFFPTRPTPHSLNPSIPRFHPFSPFLGFFRPKKISALSPVHLSPARLVCSPLLKPQASGLKPIAVPPRSAWFNQQKTAPARSVAVATVASSGFLVSDSLFPVPFSLRRPASSFHYFPLFSGPKNMRLGVSVPLW
ncbi:MAG TPA: hypothetical protein VJZ71_18090 [Phycisphaerae bacterium]|nr:hypothetical protein [Phycisphaerae bacterium]